MRVGQIRILAWAAALVIGAIFFLSSGKVSPKIGAPPRSQPPMATGKMPPALFSADGSAAVLPIAPSDTARALSDPQLQTTHVIREPMVRAADPELTLAPPSQLRLRTSLPSHQSHSPLDTLLTEPRREHAPLQPRVSQNVAAGPVTNGPAPLPIITSANPAMEPVHAAARQHVVRGFALGDKGAVYAARIEFIQALRTIAQAVDAQAGLAPQDPQSCSMALVRGLRALSEADDFSPDGSRLDGEIDLVAIIAAHRTPACKPRKPASQLAAMQAYFDYARDELQRAAAASPVASQALAGLGKSYTTATEKNHRRLVQAKAMVFHQAAVHADPRNHLAANELGVLLARHGQWEPAKHSFLQSLRVQADAATWQNLAAIHKQLGERELAELAEQERKLFSESKGVPASTMDGKPTVQWVDPKAFSGPPEDALPPLAREKKADPPSAARSTDPKSWLRLK